MIPGIGLGHNVKPAIKPASALFRLTAVKRHVCRSTPQRDKTHRPHIKVGKDTEEEGMLLVWMLFYRSRTH